MSKTRFFSVVALGLLWLASPALAADPGKGNILFEYFTGISGTAVADLTSNAKYPNNPDIAEWRTSFLSRTDWADNYGARARGYLYPPQTGDYTFWIAGDDECQLWLSTDDTPANTTMIATVTGWTQVMDWTASVGSTDVARMKSQPIALKAGQKYYIEALLKEGGGGDSVAVAWGGPGIGAGPVLVEGKFLAPWLRDPEPMFMAQNPNPAPGAVGVTAPLLTWTPGATAMWHDVYFGTDPNPPLVASRQLFAMYYHLQGLTPGTTYYWRVDEIEIDGTTIHPGPVWTFASEPVKNYQPSPADGAASQLPGLVLTWKPGKEAVQHQVFFGTDTAPADQGKVSETKFDTGALRASTTYYWRADVVKADGTIVAGDVWSFTTADAGPANKILWEWWSNISGTAVTILTSNPAYPGNPTGSQYVDLFQSAVDWADNYGQRLWGWLKPPQTGDYTFWIAGDDEQQLWLSTDGSPTNAKMIANVAGWTPALDWDNTGGGAGGASQKSAAIKLEAGKKYFIMALGKEGGGGDSTAVAWQGPGIASREVIQGKYVDMFYLAPLQAFGPNPANGAGDTAQALSLSWNAGDKAQKHEVYFGDDKAAVAAADTSSPLFKGSQTGTTFNAGDLEWGKTYYWRVDEVNPAEADSPWKGTVWSFTTANFIPIDNMESYTDEEGSRIYETWEDGWTNNTGSTVGNLVAPFAERTIVRGGKQSMPLDYNNTKSPFYSEAEQTFAPLQNWTVHGVTDLSLWFRGRPTRFADKGNGAFTVGGSGHDIWDNADDFRFVYKRLNGDGSITAKVDSLVNTNGWAKAGVMIRETLEAGAKHAAAVITPSNGMSFPYRAATNGASLQTNQAGLAAPYWLRITRTGNVFKAERSADGKTWTMQGTEQNILMVANLYIGLCVTSHNAALTTTAEFSAVATTGGVTGSWQEVWVGDDPDLANSAAGLYVVVEDSTGNNAVVTHADPAAATLGAWTEWKVPLSSLTGVNLARVKKLSIGVGNKTAPAAGGSGRVYIDDIRVTRP